MTLMLLEEGQESDLIRAQGIPLNNSTARDCWMSSGGLGHSVEKTKRPKDLVLQRSMACALEREEGKVGPRRHQ